MQCARCRHENPPATRFCGQCGAALAMTCPACRKSNPPSNKYCGGCGTALAPAPGAAGREAAEALRTALAVAESIKFPTQIWKTHVARVKLARASGDADAAFTSVEAAHRDPELSVALRANVRVPDLAT